MILIGSCRKPVDSTEGHLLGSSLMIHNAAPSITETVTSKYRLGFQAALQGPAFLPSLPRTEDWLDCHLSLLQEISRDSWYNIAEMDV